MDNLKIIVAKNITQLRTLSHLTQLDLGRMISYSDKAISKWERGESIPDAYVLLQLSEIFGVTVDYLLHEHDDEDSPEKIIKKKTINHLAITLITIIGIYTLATLVFLILNLCGINHPMIYMYILPAVMTVLVVFNALWGNRKLGILTVSGLVLSIIFLIYLIFLNANNNLWQITLLSIPAEAIILTGFFIKKHSPVKNIKDQNDTE